MIHIDIKKQLHGIFGDMNLVVQTNIKKGDFVSITGASGSGKTTLLRILAGLEETQGEIKLDNQIWQNYSIKLPTQQRNIGFVFQDYALFPNMTILENLLFVNKNIDLARHLLDVTELSSLSNRYPKNLSGGQQQRVSLCRAMMNNPNLLLLDEPFSALDFKMREKLQNQIEILHKEFNTTTLMVSHNPSEIYKLSNRVIELENGQIIKDYNPRETISTHNVLQGKVIDIIPSDTTTNIVILIDNQFITITKSKEDAKNYVLNQLIKFSIDNLVV